MKPEIGMNGAYSTPRCSLRVEVIYYEEFNFKPKVRVKVLKKLKDDPKCLYEEGHEFSLEGNELENLILD